MKKNNKGFMLAEAVISGTVILTSMIVLYSTFNRLYNLYNQRITYYNIDGVYATKLMIEHLMEDDFNKKINSIFNNSTNYMVIANGKCQTKNSVESDEIVTYINVDIDQNICEKIQKLYSINSMIITEYDESVLINEVAGETKLNKLDDGTSLTLNQSFKDYISFVGDYYGVSNSDAKYSYLVLTEIKDGEKYYYSNLGIG